MSKGSGYKLELKTAESSKIIEASDGSISLNLTMKLERRRRRQLVVLPDGTEEEPRPWDVEPTVLQLALARGHRWLRMLESGEVRSLKQIAEKEGVDNSYVSRMVNLTNLAPDIVEAILDDQIPDHVTLFDLAVNPMKLWCDQRTVFDSSV